MRAWPISRSMSHDAMRLLWSNARSMGCIEARAPLNSAQRAMDLMAWPPPKLYLIRQHAWLYGQHGRASRGVDDAKSHARLGKRGRGARRQLAADDVHARD